MPTRDKIHYSVRRALEKDGWTILADPFTLSTTDVNSEVDLEAEKFIEIEKANQKILVEIKSFTNFSLFPEFYTAQGQYIFYRDGVEELALEHELYLAISTVSYYRLQQKPTLLKRMDKNQIKLIIVDLNTETVKQWIK